MSQQTRPFSIAFMGDIMLDRAVGEHFFKQPDDFKFSEIADILKNYDIVLANLENPVGTQGTPHPKQDPNVAFRCHPETLAVLKNLGVNIVTLANNHMLDYGEETLSDTLMHLDAAGIQHLGAGKDYQQANKPLFLDINNQKIAIIGSVFLYSASTEMAKKKSAGVADFRIKHILKKIKSLVKKGYKVIVTLHWGIEYSFYPLPYQSKQARMMVDAGAAIILGHGPHYPQGIERYKNTEIVYSVGNFIFDEPFLYSKRGYIYGTEINAKGGVNSSKIYPFNIVNHCPVLLPQGEKSRLGITIKSLNTLYQRKTRLFWKNLNNVYFQDIVKRTFRMKSFKFLLMPPVSFYFSTGIKNMLKKIKLKNVSRIVYKKFS